MQRSVRLLTQDDAGAVGALLEDCYATLMPAGYVAAGVTPPDAVTIAVMSRPQRELLDGGCYFGAFVDSELAACGGWSREDPSTRQRRPGIAHLRHFGTHPQHVYEGHGRAVFDACVLHMRGQGVTRIECFAGVNAESFYAAMGLQRVRQVSIPIGDGAPVEAVLMTCALTLQAPG